MYRFLNQFGNYEKYQVTDKVKNLKIIENLLTFIMTYIPLVEY